VCSEAPGVAQALLNEGLKHTPLAVLSRPVVGTRNETFIGRKLAPYNPTNIDACLVGLEMLSITKDDVIYDLGCGDARFLIEACLRYPDIRATGVEYDKSLCNRAVECIRNRRSSLISDRVTINHDNVLNADFLDATAIFIYLVPEGMRALKGKLIQQLEKGARVVTYVFSIPELTPIHVSFVLV
jgi:precorrin-6B methylase 2